ncbi:hypothetical protein AAC387_Pa12g1669 [Persea americana]
MEESHPTYHPICNCWISVTTLTGEIPSRLGSLLMSCDLNLSNNLISGSIPAGVARKESLVSLDLSYNRLEGPLPDGIAIERASPEALQNNRGLGGNTKLLHPCDSSSTGHCPAHKFVVLVIVMVSLAPCLIIGGLNAKHRARPPSTRHLYTSLISLTSVSQQVQIRSMLRTSKKNKFSVHCANLGWIAPWWFWQRRWRPVVRS